MTRTPFMSVLAACDELSAHLSLVALAQPEEQSALAQAIGEALWTASLSGLAHAWCLARDARDTSRMALCERALNGDTEARRECARLATAAMNPEAVVDATDPT